ncbi:MAG: hypothetical protein HY525_05555 [Betaproteobacteria bacterium]|nr:hypothetical protein [Acidobacteriota bacterium]MBI4189987.1 hypothetical protein [Betaproteobacteria bacterium]
MGSQGVIAACPPGTVARGVWTKYCYPVAGGLSSSGGGYNLGLIGGLIRNLSFDERGISVRVIEGPPVTDRFDYGAMPKLGVVSHTTPFAPSFYGMRLSADSR